VRSVRKAAPETVKRAGRHVFEITGTATAALRLQPDFILIGAQRCGTTSLFRSLLAHPQVVRPTFHQKGINYFDLNYYRGVHWYRGHFPIAEIARRRSGRDGRPSPFEASGYYLYHPFALERMASDMPSVKLVVMLRDPVERAFSAYKHEFARGYESESFEDALRMEDQRLAGEVDRMRADLRYESLPHRHQSYRHRGHYAEQLERVFRFFPRHQVHIIDSEAFFAQPATEYDSLLAFLGLRAFEPARFDQYNGRPSVPMDSAIRGQLEDYYRPHDERLVSLLGRKPYWVQRVR